MDLLFSRFRLIRSLTRHKRGLLACSAFAALLHAATPEPQLTELDELDEVLVSGDVPRPLEDYVEFPRFDSVAISPGGTHLAMGWSEDSYYRRVSGVDMPSMKPHSSGLLQQHYGVTDLH